MHENNVAWYGDVVTEGRAATSLSKMWGVMGRRVSAVPDVLRTPKRTLKTIGDLVGSLRERNLNEKDKADILEIMEEDDSPLAWRATM